MNWNRQSYGGLLALAFFAYGCAADEVVDAVGDCKGPLEGRDTVMLDNMVVYGGQAIMNKACASKCHSSTASSRERQGAPADLDFDLLPIAEKDASGTTKSGSSTIVKLKSAQIAGLRERQEKILEHRNAIWLQVQDGLMPPTGTFASALSAVFSSSEKTPCKKGTQYSKLKASQTREVLRNWLACGAPLVETNGAKVEKSSTEGAAGDQYPACAPAAVPTLESLLKSTFSECGGCHNGVPTAPPPAFFSLDALAESLRTTSECGGKPFVSPGEPEESYLLDLLKDPNPDCMHDRMPKGGDPLSERALKELSAWIEAGAPTTAADLSELTEDSQSASEDDDMDADEAQSSSDDEDSASKDAGRSKSR